MRVTPAINRRPEFANQFRSEGCKCKGDGSSEARSLRSGEIPPTDQFCDNEENEMKRESILPCLLACAVAAAAVLQSVALRAQTVATASGTSATTNGNAQSEGVGLQEIVVTARK